MNVGTHHHERLFSDTLNAAAPFCLCGSLSTVYSKEPLLLLLLLLCDVLHIDEERGTCAYNATVGHGLADDPQSSVDPDLIITALPTKKFQSVDKYLNLDYFDSEIGCGISLKNLFRNGA